VTTIIVGQRYRPSDVFRDASRGRSGLREKWYAGRGTQHAKLSDFQCRASPCRTSVYRGTDNTSVPKSRWDRLNKGTRAASVETDTTARISGISCERSSERPSVAFEPAVVTTETSYTLIAQSAVLARGARSRLASLTVRIPAVLAHPFAPNRARSEPRYCRAIRCAVTCSGYYTTIPRSRHGRPVSVETTSKIRC